MLVRWFGRVVLVWADADLGWHLNNTQMAQYLTRLYCLDTRGIFANYAPCVLLRPGGVFSLVTGTGTNVL